jgi:hypothetical protein
VFRGEVPKAEEALFSVKRSAIVQRKKSFHVFLASSEKRKNPPQFKVKGNYLKRNCTILHGSQIIAEASITCTISFVFVFNPVLVFEWFRSRFLETLVLAGSIWSD